MTRTWICECGHANPPSLWQCECCGQWMPPDEVRGATSVEELRFNPQLGFKSKRTTCKHEWLVPRERANNSVFKTTPLALEVGLCDHPPTKDYLAAAMDDFLRSVIFDITLDGVPISQNIDYPCGFPVSVLMEEMARVAYKQVKSRSKLQRGKERSVTDAKLRLMLDKWPNCSK